MEPAGAWAQMRGDRIAIAFNVGEQATSNDFSDRITFERYVETGPQSWRRRDVDLAKDTNDTCPTFAGHDSRGHPQDRCAFGQFNGLERRSNIHG